MAHKAPFEQLTGPLEVYVAPYSDDLEEPDVFEAPASPWVRLGDTAGAQSVDHLGALRFFRDNAWQGPRKAVRPIEDLLLKFTLVGLTLENYARILDDVADVEATSATSATIGTKQVPIERGFSPTEYALIFRGEVLSPYGAYPGHYCVLRGVFDGEPTPAFTKDGRPGIEVELHAYEEGELRVEFGIAALCATNAGLYYTPHFTFQGDRPVRWERIGDAKEITRFACDPEDPLRLQVAVVGFWVDSANDTSVWIRQPAVSDDWQPLLTVAEAGVLTGAIPQSSARFVWAVYNHVENVIHITWEARSTTLKFLLTYFMETGEWTVADLKATYSVGDLNVQNNGFVLISLSDEFSAPGVIAFSTPTDDFTTAPRVKELSQGGGWTPRLAYDTVTEIDYVGQANEFSANAPILMTSVNNYDVSIDDPRGDLEFMGVISANAWYAPRGDLKAHNDYVWSVREGKLTVAYKLRPGSYDLYVQRAIAELDDGGRALAYYGTALALARKEAEEAAPHLVFSTLDNGATVYEKGGEHAGEVDGGGDSIPYIAQVAFNGLVLFDESDNN